MKKFIFFIFILFLSCKEQKKINKNRNNNTPYLTVIIDKSINENILLIREKDFKNDNELLIKAQSDTINIKVNNIELLSYGDKKNKIDSILVRKGDTIIFSNLNNKLTSKIKNKDKNKYDKSYLKLNYQKNKIDSLINLFFKFNYQNPFVIENENTFKVVYPIIFNEANISNEDKIIYLLKAYNKIYLKQKEIAHKFKNLDEYKLSMSLFLKNMFLNLNFIYNNCKSDKIKKFLVNDFIPLYAKENIYIDFGTVRSLIFNIYFDSNYEHSKIFNNVSNYFDSDVSKKARIICLYEMVNQKKSFSEISYYFNKYISYYNKDNYIQYFENINFINLKKTYSSKIDVFLKTNFENKIISLNEIIETSKDKIILIDFWASWCAPCRAAMPASRKLHEKYKNKNIQFLYVSIDENLENWQKANLKENLSIKNSFLAINYPEATFYKENKLNYIPRYMIFHKGKLVNNDAPSPDSPEIIKELNKYLDEE